MATPRDVVLANLATIRERVARAAERARREPSGVRLVAAAKSVPADSVGWVVDAGVPNVGENYVQELRAKRADVRGATWHFIGTLQSRAAPAVAELSDVVETVVPGRAMRRLAARAAALDRTLPALVEVDFTGERSGVVPERVAEAAIEVAETPGLALAGLMTLPPLPAAAEDSRPHFRRLRELLDAIGERHPQATELSMGMSLDYEVAVEEGATMIRIGTALFGARSGMDRGRT